MRIGLFTDTYPPFINGVSTSVSMLKHALEKKGHTVYVVTVNPDNMKYVYNEEEHVIRIPGVPIGIYDYRLTGIYPLKAINTVKGWNLDIIHSHTEFGIGTFARLIAKQLNIPLVHTYHTMYEDYIHYITKGYFDKSSKKIVEYLTLFYCDKTASELIVPTKKTYDLFIEKYKIDKNVHIVPTGIEIERFYDENIDREKLLKLREALNLKETDFVTVFVGRLAEEKNVTYLLDVQKNISKEYKNIKFVIVGDGPDFDKYKKFVEENNLQNSVILTGKVPWEEIPYYYHLAKVFLTASVTETQGLTVIEAMAAGVTPVCIKDESFLNTVINDFNGKIFETKEECKEAILEYYNKQSLLERHSKQARINSEQYSSNTFAEAILNVYNYALKNKEKQFGLLSKLVGKNDKNNKSVKDNKGDKDEISNC